MEAGTFLAAAAITGGDIILENVQEEHLKPVLAKLAECNIKTERTRREYGSGEGAGSAVCR